jgi:flagellar basal-body rod protein FlgF
MIPGLYSAASGMVAEENRQAVISNNIANAATTGYKRQAPVSLGFYQMISQKARHPFHYQVEAAPGGGVKMVETYTNRAMGALRQTGNDLNVALSGPGYFAVDTPQGERFTRSGDFTLDIDGHLATQSGYKVRSTEGAPIDARGGDVRIGADGSVIVDEVHAGFIRMIEFEQPERLLREGQNLYRATEEVMEASMVAESSRMQQSFLEMSNVNLPHEMIQMIMGMRFYEANQKMIQTADATMGKLIEQVTAG